MCCVSLGIISLSNGVTTKPWEILTGSDSPKYIQEQNVDLTELAQSLDNKGLLN